MMHFFIEGGFGMFPVLVVGLILLYASLRYLLDGEPIRLRFILLLSLAQLALIAQASVANVSHVFHGVSRAKPHVASVMLLQGLKESTRPAFLGLGLLALALIRLAIGAYRVGVRELRAARGG